MPGGLWSLAKPKPIDLPGLSTPAQLWERQKAFAAQIFNYRFLPIVLFSDPLPWFSTLVWAMFSFFNGLHYSDLIKGLCLGQVIALLQRNVEKLRKDQGRSTEIILVDGKIERGRAKKNVGKKGKGELSLTSLNI